MSRFLPLSQSSQMSTLVGKELEVAKIPLINKFRDWRICRASEPEGKLGHWFFTREEMSWRAEAPYDGEYKGLEKSIVMRFLDSLYVDEIRVHAAIHIQNVNQIFSVTIYSIEGLNAFAELIRSLEAQKDAPTETPVETVATSAESKPPLYQIIVDMIEHLAKKAESAPSYHWTMTDRGVLLNIALFSSSFPDPAERAWMRARLDEIRTKYPNASRIFSLGDTIELFKT